MKYYFSLFVLVFFIGLNEGVLCQSMPLGSPEQVGMSTQRLERAHQKMQTYIDDQKLGGIATMVARKGMVISHETFGYQDMETKKEVTANSIFRIYSMSKPITAVAVMMLYEEGKFQLNDPVAKYIPEFKDLKVYEDGQLVEPKKNMTVKHLLTHTSGLSYGWNPSHVDTLYGLANLWEPGTDIAEFTRKVGQLPLNFHPGTKFEYGVSIDILGRLVEVLSGQTFGEFLQQRIFDPLGMEDTGFSVPASKHDRFMEGYQPSREGGIEKVNAPFFHSFKGEVKMHSGGGGLASTLNDYMRFAQMLLNQGEYNGKRLLSRKTVELMTTDNLEAGVKYKEGYGFGFAMEVMQEVAPSGNLGSSGEYRWSGMANTYFWIDPQEELIGMVFTQFLPYGYYPLQAEFQTLVYQAIVD